GGPTAAGAGVFCGPTGGGGGVGGGRTAPGCGVIRRAAAGGGGVGAGRTARGAISAGGGGLEGRQSSSRSWTFSEEIWASRGSAITSRRAVVASSTKPCASLA